MKTMQFAREGYYKGHLRWIRDDATDNPPLLAKQQKIQRILSRFDTLIALLQRLDEKFPTPIRHPDLPDGFLAVYAAATDPENRLDLIYKHFTTSSVKGSQDLEAEGLYFIATDTQTFLVVLDQTLPIDDTVPMRTVDTAKRLKSLSRKQFYELGNRGWLIRLQKKIIPRSPVKKKQPEKESETPSGEAGFDVHERDMVLDIGAFTQLHDSAQRSGMLPDADQIAYVRDREFRMGKFQKALLAMEGLQGKFSANAAAKQAEIRREDMDISSGRIKMSPKELQAKRMRDQALQQAIERARSRFSRVLDGLRILSRTLEES